MECRAFKQRLQIQLSNLGGAHSWECSDSGSKSCMTGFAIQGSVRPKHISCQQSHCHATIFRQVQRQGNISSQIRGGARTSSGTQAQISTCLNTALRGRECRRHCRLDSKRDLNRESERCRTVVRAEPEGLEDHNLYAEQELRPVGPHSDNRVAEVIHALQHRSGDSIGDILIL